MLQILLSGLVGTLLGALVTALWMYMKLSERLTRAEKDIQAMREGNETNREQVEEQLKEDRERSEAMLRAEQERTDRRITEIREMFSSMTKMVTSVIDVCKQVLDNNKELSVTARTVLEQLKELRRVG